MNRPFQLGPLRPRGAEAGHSFARDRQLQLALQRARTRLWPGGRRFGHACSLRLPGFGSARRAAGPLASWSTSRDRRASSRCKACHLRGAARGSAPTAWPARWRRFRLLRQRAACGVRCRARVPRVRRSCRALRARVAPARRGRRAGSPIRSAWARESSRNSAVARGLIRVVARQQQLQVVLLARRYCAWPAAARVALLRLRCCVSSGATAVRSGPSSRPRRALSARRGPQPAVGVGNRRAPTRAARRSLRAGLLGAGQISLQRFDAAAAARRARPCRRVLPQARRSASRKKRLAQRARSDAAEARIAAPRPARRMRGFKPSPCPGWRPPPSPSRPRPGRRGSSAAAA